MENSDCFAEGAMRSSYDFGHKTTQAHLRLLHYCVLHTMHNEGLESWNTFILCFELNSYAFFHLTYSQFPFVGFSVLGHKMVALLNIS